MDKGGASWSLVTRNGEEIIRPKKPFRSRLTPGEVTKDVRVGDEERENHSTGSRYIRRTSVPDGSVADWLQAGTRADWMLDYNVLRTVSTYTLGQEWPMRGNSSLGWPNRRPRLSRQSHHSSRTYSVRRSAGS